jgi:site-specific recombinase XerD
VTVNSKACEPLRSYLLVRPADATDGLVFQSMFRRGMGPRSIEDAVNKHLRAAGIHGVSVQTLRDTSAIHTLRQGTSQRVLQDVLDVSRWTSAGYAGQAGQICAAMVPDPSRTEREVLHSTGTGGD